MPTPRPAAHLIGAPKSEDTADLYAGDIVGDPTAPYFDAPENPQYAYPDDASDTHGPTGFDLASPDSTEDGRTRRRRWWSRLGNTLAVIVIIVAVVLAAAFVGIFVLGDPGPSRPTEETTTRETEDSTSPAAGDTNGNGYNRPAPVDAVEDTRPTDPLFSWWGDGLSAVAATYSPSIGTKEHGYFWNVDTETTPEAAVSTIGAVKTAEDNGVAPEPAKLGTLGGVVVFAFGNSADVSQGTLDQLRSVIGSGRTLLLVGVGATSNTDQPWRVDLNNRLKATADDNANTRYIDWQAQVDSNPDYVHDNFLLTQSGAAAWANLINREITSVYAQ